MGRDLLQGEKLFPDGPAFAIVQRAALPLSWPRPRDNIVRRFRSGDIHGTV
jgi:hypothetical protein